MSERRVPLGPVWFLPKRGFVVVPILVPYKLPDGTQARSALVGFVDGRYVAFANVCRHLAIQLDLGDGEVMDDENHQIVCHHHGAIFEPDTGECVVGPCHGDWLWRWRVEIEGGEATLVIGGEGEVTPKGPSDE